MAAMFKESKENYETYLKEFVKVKAFKFIPDEKIYVDLNSVNESIYNLQSNS